MPKYLVHIPVFGSIDKIVEADSPDEVIENYFKNRDSLLKFHGNVLYDDVEGIQIVEATDHNVC